MAAYKFKKYEKENQYQLVRTGWLLDKKLDVYYTKSNFGRHVLTVSYKQEKASTDLMSSNEIIKVTRLLSKIGITKKDMQKAKSSLEEDPKAEKDLDNIITCMSATG